MTSLVAWPRLSWTTSYAVCLLGVTTINGILYGKARYVKIVASADPGIYPGVASRLSGNWPRIKAYVVLFATFFWDLLYGEYYVAIHKWAILRPFVFIKYSGWRD